MSENKQYVLQSLRSLKPLKIKNLKSKILNMLCSKERPIYMSALYFIKSFFMFRNEFFPFSTLCFTN